jgi:LacI family transcriptional regulator
VDRFQQLRVGGIIVTPALTNADHLAVARAAGTPIVVMSRRWLGGDYVTADNLAGGRLAAHHLLGRGHRRIGLIAPDYPLDGSFRDRIQGFRETLTAAGMSIPTAWDLRTKAVGIEDGVEAAQAILALRRRPSAIFATTDLDALGLIQSLLAHGVRVPEDIAVVGYDDIPFAACSQVPLTTVKIPVRQIGELAAEILFDRIDGKRPKKRQQRLLSPELVIRASSP